MKKILVIVASTATIFSALWGVYTYWNPFEDNLTNSDEFLGIWQAEYSYPITNGTSTIRGTTEYFKNGKYNFKGMMIINSTIDSSDTLKIIYDVDGTGYWNNDSKNFYITTKDFKSYPRSLQLNNKPFDLNEPVYRALIPKYEEFIPKGMSEQYDIVKTDSTSITFELDDPFGKTFSIVMQKVDKRFQRQLFNQTSY